jgi:hypothetical protein
VPTRDALPTHVLTPEAMQLPLLDDALAADVGGRCGLAVQMAHLRHGIFDDGSISVIGSATVREVCRLAGVPEDVRRFRPNILVRTLADRAFEEDEWVGAVLAFGESDRAPTSPSRCRTCAARW